jgi:hypothetical protein
MKIHKGYLYSINNKLITNGMITFIQTKTKPGIDLILI